MPAYFAYYRVSTQKQGASGLSLEAQQAAVVNFLKGDRAQVVSFRQLAVELNALGFTAPRGGTFNQGQVQRLHERLLLMGKHPNVE